MELLKLLLILIAVLSNIHTMKSSEFLVHEYYKEKCPLAEEIVRHNMEVAIFKDPRLAASLLRLHFHDCFVMVIKLTIYKHFNVRLFAFDCSLFVFFFWSYTVGC